MPQLQKVNDEIVLHCLLLCLNEENNRYMPSCNSSSRCILLSSCCFNLWESPHGCFNMVAWLSTRVDRIIGLVAANKFLFLSDPVSACSIPRSPGCLCACLFICPLAHTNQGYLYPKRKLNPLCVFPSPMVSHFFLLPHLYFLTLPCCKRRAKSVLWTEVLSGYYF